MVPYTEEQLAQRVTHLRCGNCLVIEPVEDASGLTDLEEAQELELDCGCDDPVAHPLIAALGPIIQDPEIDDQYKVTRNGHTFWEYELDSLLDEMGLR